jgi:hypothetical protein
LAIGHVDAIHGDGGQLLAVPISRADVERITEAWAQEQVDFVTRGYSGSSEYRMDAYASMRLRDRCEPVLGLRRIRQIMARVYRAGGVGYEQPEGCAEEELHETPDEIREREARADEPTDYPVTRFEVELLTSSWIHEHLKVITALEIHRSDPKTWPDYKYLWRRIMAAESFLGRERLTQLLNIAYREVGVGLPRCPIQLTTEEWVYLARATLHLPVTPKPEVEKRAVEKFYREARYLAQEAFPSEELPAENDTVAPADEQ